MNSPSRRFMVVVLTTLGLVPVVAHARRIGNWQDGGVRICAGPAAVREHLAGIADGEGGGFFVWTDRRATPSRIYGMRLDGSGHAAPNWDPAGLAVGPGSGNQTYPQLIPDGAGGCFVTWLDARSGVLQVWAQRLRGDGTPAAGWPAEGRHLSTAAQQTSFGLLADSTGTAWLIWGDVRTYPDPTVQAVQTYVSRITFDGDPVVEWPPDGVQLTTTPVPTSTYRSELSVAGPGASDHHGGLFLAWGQAITYVWCELTCHTAYYRQAYLTHVGPNRVMTTLSGNPDTYAGHVGTDAAGYAWYVDGGPFHYRVQHFTAAGALLSIYSPGTDWPAPEFVPAADSGVLVLTPGLMEGLSLGFDGQPRPGWGTGLPFVEPMPSNPTTGTKVCWTSMGGWLLVWLHRDVDPNGDLYAEFRTVDGAAGAGWNPAGEPVADGAGAQAPAALFPDGFGGAIVGWTDTRSGQSDVYAQLITVDSPTPVRASPILAEATPERVHVAWQLDRRAGTVGVQRQGADGAWVALGDGRIVEGDRVEYEDVAVVAEQEYVYRLASGDGGTPIAGSEIAVRVPAAWRLALAGARPNPARGMLHVAFELTAAGPAQLQVVDVAGRTVDARRFDRAAPGVHELDLAPGAAPGLYFIRLTQAGETRTRRVCIIP